MSGSDIVMDVGKGAVAEKSRLPLANDALVVTLYKASGLEADATLKRYTDLASLLAGTTDELTDASYARKNPTGIVVTVDTTNDRVDCDSADIVWTALAGAASAALAFNYDDDTTSGTDSNIKPLTKHSFDVTPDGTDLTATVNNYFRAN